MAGYIGSKTSVAQVDGYTRTEADAEFVSDPNGAVTVDGSGNVGIGTAVPTLPLSVDGDIWQGNTNGVEIGRITNNVGWYDFGASSNVNGAQMSHPAIVRFNTAGQERLRIDANGYVSVAGNIGSNSYYTYNAYVSSTVKLRLKLPDGTDFPKGQAAIVGLFVEGTGTGLTTQLYTVTHNGAGTSGISLLQGSSAGVSNRPAMSLDASGYPTIYTGHPSIYSVIVRVMPFRNLG